MSLFISMFLFKSNQKNKKSLSNDEIAEKIINKTASRDLIDKFDLTKYYNGNRQAVLKVLESTEWSNDFIKKHMHYIPIKFIEDNITKYDWNFSSHKFRNICLEIVNDYPLLPWDWKIISTNYGMNKRFVRDNLDKPLDCYYVRRYLSEDVFDEFISKREFKILNKRFYDYIPLCIIEKYIDRMNFKNVSRNHNLTLDFVRKYPDKDWDYVYIEERFEDIIKNELAKKKIIQETIPIAEEV